MVLKSFLKHLKKKKQNFYFLPPNSFGRDAEELFDRKFSKSKYLERIVSGSEQGASHMADGYARVTGNPGVVVCDSDTSGTNTITGLQTANMDSASLGVFVCHFTEDKNLTNIFEHIDQVGISRIMY